MEQNTLNEIRNFDIPNPFKLRALYDFELCVGLVELKQTISEINCNGYTMVGVTQHENTYTVFFRRPAT